MSNKKRSRSSQGGGRSVKKAREIEKTTSQGTINLANLPTDIMLQIFIKLGAIEILLNAQYVCTSWYKLAKEPILYRDIDFQGAEKFMCSSKNRYARKPEEFLGIAKEAVNRSCGQLVKLSCIDGFGWLIFLDYVNCTNSLKSLKIRKGMCISGLELQDVIRGLNFVEELDICFGHFPTTAVEEAGRSCLKLTSFSLTIWDNGGHRSSDEDVWMIVRNMRQLRHLSLARFLITNNVLQIILDGCPHLEHLDLQQSLGKKGMNKSWLKRCAKKIRTVIPPSKYVAAKNVPGSQGMKEIMQRL